MKPFLRILVILVSIAIVVIALFPPNRTAEPDIPELVESPPPEADTKNAEESKSHQLIRDMLGGAAIDQGKKAKENISGLNEEREELFEENGL